MDPSPEGLRLSVDIGGTFTDLVALNQRGRLWNVKVPTTPADPSQGVLEAVRQFIDRSQCEPRRVNVVVHATTLASNALLTGKLPPVALITTEGFRDVLEIGRQNRPELYNLQVERPPPLVTRRYRFEMKERVAYDGRVLEPLDRNQTRRVAREIRRLRVESVAVSFLHSYANPRHERTARKVLREECPEVWVTLSSELLPEFREYERTSTTVVNACLQPIISAYLKRLQVRLRAKGIRAPLFVMQSNGGTLSSQHASEEPARAIESGPVAGAVAARFYGKLSEAKEVISLDVGGTTAKAGVWTGERFELTTDYEVGGRIHGIRRLEGSGYPVRFPFVDLVEVGAGGGSVARVDLTKILHVGPESAEAVPGPACYGQGGAEATVTDANLVLGRLNPDYLLGGALRVYPELAEKVVEQNVARPLKTSTSEASIGILRVAVANMAGALRAASVERGRDPRDMLLVAFGGAGPMHACEIAQELGIRRVLIPPSAGLLSGLGLLLAEPLHDFVQTVLLPVDKIHTTLLSKIFNRMESEGRALLGAEGVSEREMSFERFFDLRYLGQAYEISIIVPRRGIDRGLVRRAVESFHGAHNLRYGYSDPAEPVEVVNLRVNCRGKTRALKIKQPKAGGKPVAKALRRVTFAPSEVVENCPVFDRMEVGAGFEGKGPVILEDYDSTAVIPTRARYAIDENGSINISL